MQDQGFPLIRYEKEKTYREWGLAHGEEFKQGIHELIEIRKELMQAKNPKLTGEPLTRLAKEQLDASRQFAPEVAEELEGIRDGAGVSDEEIVILNNYTDFRDIELPEEGCSTLYVRGPKEIVAGQTWDMHGSAKNYVSVIHAPATEKEPEMILFSLVGCVGMMGFNTWGGMLGVNNINTGNARAGLIWPLLVREVLRKSTRADMEKCLTQAPVTSGHNYILASKEKGQMWEIAPTLQAKVSEQSGNEEGAIFHTNHCLDEEMKKIETVNSLNSTTHLRYDLITKKIATMKDFESLKTLLTDHEDFPKSICSHFQSNLKDPSFTCGGGLGDLDTLKLHFWRGCPEYDDNYVSYDFELEDGTFQLTSKHS